MVRPESCAELAGESPVPVSAKTPDSWPQLRGGILGARARRQAASSTGQTVWLGGAKLRSVTSSEPCSVVTLLKAERQEEAEQVMASEGSRQRVKTWTRSVGLPGVWGTECGDSSVRNRRDPPWPRRKPGEGAGYKPSGEKTACQEGVRGGRSTDEGGEKPLEGRASAWDGACVQEISARECP